MPILDIQRRGQQIGRIRTGHKVMSSKGKLIPAKLDTFRFTTSNRRIADAIVSLYGGEVRAWEGEWEALTPQTVIGVVVPPRDQIVSQWYEMWNKGGCIRRCDSRIEQRSGKECLCPHAEDPYDEAAVHAAALERLRLSKLQPPQACGLKTRISLMIPDLPGLGIFRLDTASFNAAGETGDKADLLQMARDKGIFLPAELRIEQRIRVADGKRTPYPVPVLEILNTFREIHSGVLESGGMAAQLPPAPGQAQRALTSGAAPHPAVAKPAPAVEAAPARTAQQIADLALKAKTLAEVEFLGHEANGEGLDDDLVNAGGDVYEELKPLLTRRWWELKAATEGGAA